MKSEKSVRATRIRLAGAIAGLVLLAASCGGDDSSSSDTDAPVTTAAAPTAPNASTADGGGSAVPSADAPVGSADLDALVAAATAEGSVTVYSSQGLDSLNALAEAFEEKYPGVDVEAIRIGDNDMIPRLETELSTGTNGADLIVNASPTWMAEHAAAGDFLAPSGSPQLLGDGEYAVSQYGHEGLYFEVGGSVLTFAWNTNELPDGLEDYESLLDADLGDGKIGVIELASAPAADFYQWLDVNVSPTFFDELAAQRPRIYPSTLPIGEALASGEILATNWGAPIQLEASKAAGAPVDYDVSEHGAYGSKQYAAVLAQAASPAAAELFADFMLTMEGQALINPFSSAVLADVPNAVTTNDRLPEPDPAATTAEKVEEQRLRFDEAYRG